MTTHDISKLPKWAQNRIENLEREVESFPPVKSRTQARNTDVFLQSLVRGNTPMPQFTKFVFEFGDTPGDQSITVGKSERAQMDVLEIYGSGRKGYAIATLPVSSNLLNVFPFEV